MLTAFETTGTIGPNGKIVVDGTYEVVEPTAVRVIVLLPESDEITENEWMKTAAANDAFDFLHDADEDIYSLDDGSPVTP